MKKRGGWGRVGVQGVFARERPSTFAGCELPSQDVSDPRILGKCETCRETLLLIP